MSFIRKYGSMKVVFKSYTIDPICNLDFAPTESSNILSSGRSVDEEWLTHIVNKCSKTGKYIVGGLRNFISQNMVQCKASFVLKETAVKKKQLNNRSMWISLTLVSKLDHICITA